MIRPRSRRALILLAVIIQCGVLLVLGISLLSLSTADARLLVRRAEGASALALARAGLARAGWVLSRPDGLAGWSQDDVPFPQSPGAYSLRIRADAQDPRRFEVTATGGVPDLVDPRARRSVVVHMRREAVLAFAALSSSGPVTATGGATITGDLLSGAGVTLASPSASLALHGDVRAVGTVDRTVHADGRIREGVRARSLPTVDAAALQARARTQGTLYASRDAFMSALAAQGGVIRGTWCVADASPLQVGAPVDLQGTLVLSGEATFDGGVTHAGDATRTAVIGLGTGPLTFRGLTTTGTGPTVVVAAGPVVLSGPGVARGSVYASALTLGDGVDLRWDASLAGAAPSELAAPPGEGVRLEDWLEP